MHILLIELAKNIDYSPYFLRQYERLLQNYTATCSTTALIIAHESGYIFGETAGYNNLKAPTRNSLTADIYFVFVKPQFRSDGKGYYLYNCFEKEVVNRYKQMLSNFNIPSKLSRIEIRITMKYCIQKSTPFWNKNGFTGTQSDYILSKHVYF